jgi:uncharacterized protein YodC (DUF2158 family)
MVIHAARQEAGQENMAEQQQFKPGDVVQLKSGGPAMTVGGRVAEDSIRCHWFDGATAKTEIFPVTAIRLYEGPKTAAGLRRT